MKPHAEYILHIGTVKVICLKVITMPEGIKKIAAFGTCRAEGFERGAVKDLGKAAETLKEVFRVVMEGDKETMIQARVVVSPPHLKNFIFASSIYFYGNPHALALRDVREVIAQTRSVATIPLNEMIIQAVPQEFLVNDLTGINNPIGLEATRLGVTLRLFTMDYTVYNNLLRVLERADVDALELIPEALVSSHAVLTPEEKDEGVVLVDVGGYSTRFECYKNSILAKSQTIPCGSEMITEVLANNLNLKMDHARRLKETFGSTQAKPQFSEELIPVQDRDEKESQQHIARKRFDEEIQPAIRELMGHLSDTIRQFATEVSPISKVVFTGGGCKLDGFLDAMQDSIPHNLRLGLPRNFANLPVTLMDAVYSDVVGAINYSNLLKDPQAYSSPVQNFFSRTVNSAKKWVAEYF